MIIYEGHLKNLTMHPSAAQLGDLLARSGCSTRWRTSPRNCSHLRRGGLPRPLPGALGFTSLELLPVHETNSDQVGRINGTTNLGYQTIGFFAPNRDYAYDKPRRTDP